MQDDRRRHRDLRRAGGDGFQKGEMLGENGAGPFDRLMDDELLDRDGLALLVAMEEVALLGGEAAAAQRLAEEVDDIALAAEFTVADRMQADRLLQRHDLADRVVLDPLELDALDLALAIPPARFDQVRGPQQAADLIGAMGWRACGHRCPPAG